MSRELERSVVTEYFRATWNANYSYAVAWPNHEFDTPVNSIFVVFNLVDRGTMRETLGRTYLKRHRGTIQVDIYVPQGLGTKTARQIADFLENQFDSVDLPMGDGSYIFFRTPTSREIPANVQRAANLDDNWYRYMVELPYDRQETVVR